MRHGIRYGEIIVDMTFAIGTLIHNKLSNEDGRITGTQIENGALVYMVSVSLDATSWMMGARESHWPESEAELSTNKFLMQNQ